MNLLRPYKAMRILLVGTVLLHVASCNVQNRTQPSKFLQSVNHAKTFTELHNAIHVIRKNATVEDVGRLAKELIAQLDDPTPLSIDVTQVSEYSFPFCASDDMSVFQELTDSLVDPSDRLSVSILTVSRTTHDIRYAGGRAAWAIEQVFGLLLPSIRSTYDDVRTAERIRAIQHEVFDNWQFRVKTARVLQLDVAGRIHVAKKSTSPRIMLLLADDNSKAVRVHVAASVWTPTDVRRKILKNVNVRADDEALRTARQLQNAYGSGIGHWKLESALSSYQFQTHPYAISHAFDVKWFLHELDSATNYYRLQEAIESVRRTARAQDIRPIADVLIARIPVERILSFEVNAEDVSDASDNSLRKRFPFESSTVANATLGKDPISPRDFTYTTQDIGYVGGRSTWALEQIFGLLLPAIQRNYAKQLIDERQAAIRKMVFADWENRTRIARIRQLTFEDRVDIAKNHPNPRIQAVLADDPSIRVRVALCESDRTPYSVHSRLLLEIDADFIPDLELRKRFIESASSVKLLRQRKDQWPVLRTEYLSYLKNANSPVEN